MFKIRNYKIGFDIWGLILFLVIMLPNFIWFVVPDVNDVLRNNSITPYIDMIASIFQVAMVVALCIIINKYPQKPMKKILFRGVCILIMRHYLLFYKPFTFIYGMVFYNMSKCVRER